MIDIYSIHLNKILNIYTIPFKSLRSVRFLKNLLLLFSKDPLNILNVTVKVLTLLEEIFLTFHHHGKMWYHSYRKNIKQHS